MVIRKNVFCLSAVQLHTDSLKVVRDTVIDHSGRPECYVDSSDPGQPIEEVPGHPVVLKWKRKCPIRDLKSLSNKPDTLYGLAQLFPQRK